MLRDAMAGGIQYGQTFDEMDTLPEAIGGLDGDELPALANLTTDLKTVPGRINQDPRFCIQWNAPYQGWIDGYVLGMEMDERVP